MLGSGVALVSARAETRVIPALPAQVQASQWRNILGKRHSLASSSEGLDANVMFVAANAVALEHALIALLRGLVSASPQAAATVPETMRALAALTRTEEPAHQLASAMTDELAARFSVMIDDWSPPG